MNEVLLGLLVAIPAVATVVVAVSRALRGLRDERRDWHAEAIAAIDRNTAAIQGLVGVSAPPTVAPSAEAQEHKEE